MRKLFAILAITILAVFLVSGCLERGVPEIKDVNTISGDSNQDSNVVIDDLGPVADDNLDSSEGVEPGPVADDGLEHDGVEPGPVAE